MTSSTGTGTGGASSGTTGDRRSDDDSSTTGTGTGGATSSSTTGTGGASSSSSGASSSTGSTASSTGSSSSGGMDGGSVSTDPFDPASCAGAPITFSQAVAKFSPGSFPGSTLSSYVLWRRRSAPATA